MQNSSLPGAFEILKKKRLRREILAKELKKMKKFAHQAKRKK